MLKMIESDIGVKVSEINEEERDRENKKEERR